MNKDKKKTDTERIEALKTQGQYEKAHRMMQETPFIIRNKAVLAVLITFSGMYHILSVTLSLITVLLLSSLFVPQLPSINPLLKYLLLGVIFVLLATLVVVAELAKSTNAREYYKAKAGNRQVASSIGITLAGLCMFSIVASSAGGYILAYAVSSEKETLALALENKTDTLENGYDGIINSKEIALANLQALASNTQARKWGLTAEETGLVETLSQEIAEMKMAKQQAIATTTNKYVGKIQANSDYTLQTTALVACIVIILELVTIYSYYFKYWYWATASSLAGQLADADISEIKTKLGRLNIANLAPIENHQVGFQIQQPTQPTQQPTQPVKEVRVLGRKDRYTPKEQIEANQELAQIIVACWQDDNPKTKTKNGININHIVGKTGKARQTVTRTLQALIDEKMLPPNSYRN